MNQQTPIDQRSSSNHSPQLDRMAEALRMVCGLAVIAVILVWVLSLSDRVANLQQSAPGEKGLLQSEEQLPVDLVDLSRFGASHGSERIEEPGHVRSDREGVAVTGDSPAEVAEADLIPANSEASGSGDSVAGTEPADYQIDQTKARILIVRGILTVFSLGMDDLAEKLRKRGYEVQVSTAAGSNSVARKMGDQIRQSRDGRKLIIIGHSLGGDLAPKLAQTFAAKKVPVDMLLMLDSTMPTSPPANVRRCVNLYQTNIMPDWAPVFRGTHVNARSQHTEMINIDIRKLAGKEKTAGINHFNIDANPWIHDLIIDAVQQLDPASVGYRTAHAASAIPGTAVGTSGSSFRIGDQSPHQTATLPTRRKITSPTNYTGRR